MQISIEELGQEAQDYTFPHYIAEAWCKSGKAYDHPLRLALDYVSKKRQHQQLMATARRTAWTICLLTVVANIISIFGIGAPVALVLKMDALSLIGIIAVFLAASMEAPKFLNPNHPGLKNFIEALKLFLVEVRPEREGEVINLAYLRRSPLDVLLQAQAIIQGKAREKILEDRFCADWKNDLRKREQLGKNASRFREVYETYEALGLVSGPYDPFFKAAELALAEEEKQKGSPVEM